VKVDLTEEPGRRWTEDGLAAIEKSGDGKTVTGIVIEWTVEPAVPVMVRL